MSHFLTFLKYNKGDFEHFPLFFNIFVIPFHSNCALLLLIFSNFKADNKCIFNNFFNIFRYFSALLSSFFRFFGPKISVIMMFFFLGKRRIMRFLTRITYYYRVLFWRFLTYNCDFEHFPLFLTFFRFHYTQIEPYYWPLFRILKPIITMFLRHFSDICRYFSALLSSIHLNSWTL